MKVVDYNYGVRCHNLLKRHASGMIRSLSLKKLFNILLFIVEFKCKCLKLKTKPFYIIIEPTNYCDHNCPRCGTHTKRSKGFMDIHLYKEIIDLFKPYCMNNSLYGQGESFLHKDIFEMIAYSEKNKCTRIF